MSAAMHMFHIEHPAQRWVFVKNISKLAYYPCTHINDDVIKWENFPRHWPFVRGIYRSPVNDLTEASDAEL